MYEGSGREGITILKEITEDRDSYRKALQIMTKELNRANTFREEQQRQRSTPYPNEESAQEEPDAFQSDATPSVDDHDENKGLEREWNDVRRTPKPIQEFDTLIVGDSMIKDIKPSLMSASNTIRKKCLRGAKV